MSESAIAIFGVSLVQQILATLSLIVCVYLQFFVNDRTYLEQGLLRFHFGNVSNLKLGQEHSLSFPKKATALSRKWITIDLTIN